ncbi:MAG: hypothetical protein Q8P41_03860 [Pseudomonadota bacterium]|nr:hypothetical protein [Pseudomonadota bacterium]
MRKSSFVGAFLAPLFIVGALGGAARAETGAETGDTAGDTGAGDTAEETGAGETAEETGGHDTAEAGDRDTDPYVDTGAVTEEVYVQDVGCAALPGAAGPGAAVTPTLLGLSLLAAAAWRRGVRGPR